MARTYASHKRSKRKRQQAVWLVFVVLNYTLTYNSVRKCYRRRFGVESSYRCVRQVRVWITSSHAALRLDR